MDIDPDEIFTASDFINEEDHLVLLNKLYGTEWNKIQNKLYGNKNILDFIIEYLKELEIKFVDDFIPYYVISIISHIMNMVNRNCQNTCLRTDCDRKEYPSNTFFAKSGSIPDLRINISLISPRGFLKNTFLNIFMDEEYGLLPVNIPTMVVGGQLTNKFLVGSKNEKGTIEYGLAWYLCSGIVGIPELSNLISSNKQTHSLNLMNSLISIADDGHAFNGVGTGIAVDYKTKMTIWTSTQPDSNERFDISSGLKRRFLMLTFVPTKKEEKILRNAYKEGINKFPNVDKIKKIREGFEWLYTNLVFDKITISNEIYNFLDELEIMHYDYQKAINIILAYNVAVYWNGEKLFVPKLDKRVKRLLRKFKQDTLITDMEYGVELNTVFKTLSSQYYFRIDDLIKDVSRRTGIAKSKVRQSIIDLRNENAFGIIKFRTVGGKKPMMILFNDTKYKNDIVVEELKKEYEIAEIKEIINTKVKKKVKK